MDYINAFWTGGLICVIGQILIDKTKLTPARILTGFVVAGVILGAVGLYEPFAEFAGAGAAVPISGFGFLMSQGVKEGLAADGALGILTGGLKSAAAGISAAIFFGLIAGLITKSGDKTNNIFFQKGIRLLCRVPLLFLTLHKAPYKHSRLR